MLAPLPATAVPAVLVQLVQLLEVEFPHAILNPVKVVDVPSAEAVLTTNKLFEFVVPIIEVLSALQIVWLAVNIQLARPTELEVQVSLPVPDIQHAARAEPDPSMAQKVEAA